MTRSGGITSLENMTSRLIVTLFLSMAYAILLAGEAAPPSPLAPLLPPPPAPRPPIEPPAPIAPLAPISPLESVATNPEKVRLEQEALENAGMSATWPDVEYAEVRGYLYFPGGDQTDEAAEEEILKDGKLHPAVVNKEGAKLSPEQVKRLLDAVRPSKISRTGVGCYFPHHGFVFYDQAGKSVAELSPCFLCGVGRAEPGNKSLTTWRFEDLAKLATELKLPVFKDFDDAASYYRSKVAPKP